MDSLGDQPFSRAALTGYKHGRVSRSYCLDKAVSPLHLMVLSDKIMELALDQGANDVVANSDGSIDVFTPPENFAAVRDAIAADNIEYEQAEIAMVPVTQVPLEHNMAEKLLGLIDALDELDDIQNVYHNADIPDEVLEKWQ